MLEDRYMLLFEKDAYNKLRMLSERTGVSKNEIVRRAILIYDYINDIYENGDSVTI